MPFDMEDHGGGGGGGGDDPRHNPAMMLDVMNATLTQLQLNCDSTGLCPFCVHLNAAERILLLLVENVDAAGAEGSPEGPAMHQHITQMMTDVAATLLKVAYKYQDPNQGRGKTNG